MDYSKKKILLVDDLDAIRNIVSARLRIKGFEITKANDGQEALEYLQNKSDDFDLILSDYDMPKMNGLELLEKVRSDASLKDKPFIMLTSRTEPEKMKAAKELGLSAWVKKPFKVDSFMSQIHYALDK